MDVEAFWQDIISQNRAALPSYFCDDAVIRWHCTNEQFTVAEYIKANCDYPGTRTGEIERIEQIDSKIVLAGKVQSEDGTVSCYVTSFITDWMAIKLRKWMSIGLMPEKSHPGEESLE